MMEENLAKPKKKRAKVKAQKSPKCSECISFSKSWVMTYCGLCGTEFFIRERLGHVAETSTLYLACPFGHEFQLKHRKKRSRKVLKENKSKDTKAVVSSGRQLDLD